MYCYCLFCETQKCQAVVQLIESRLGCRAIYPKQVQHIRKQGTMMDIERDLLPGYVFLYAESISDNLLKNMHIGGVLKALCNLDGSCELKDEDEQFALMLLERQGKIGRTKVYEEGQEIRICQGAFGGTTSRILKLDHRNGRMQVEISFARQKVRTWVEYEMIAAGSSGSVR